MDKVNSNSINSTIEGELIVPGNRSKYHKRHELKVQCSRKFQLHFLRRKGLAYELIRGEKQAYLVNLTKTSKVLFYIIPQGCIQIGRSQSVLQRNRLDIILDTPTVDYNHCRVENVDGDLYIIPESKNFDTYVNGELIHNRTELFNGDRLILGGSHYFCVLKPDQKQQKSKKMAVDYQLAFNEVLQKQKEAIRVQLEEEMCQALLDIEIKRYEHERFLEEQIQQLKMKIIILKNRIDVYKSNIQLIESNAETIRINEMLSPDLVLSTEGKVNFLADLQEIMKGPYRNKNLFKIDLMIKTAAQYTMNYNLNYEFKYTQLLDEFGLYQQKILIFDKKHNVMAVWPLSRLEVWLDIMRNNRYELYNNNPFTYVNIEWQSIEPNHK